MAFRDARLQRIQDISTSAPEFATDYSPDSLKGLENWYFCLWDTESFEKQGTTIDEFEECMAMYFGEVMV